MGTREFRTGYNHALSGRFPMCHRPGRYAKAQSFADYAMGYRHGSEVLRQRALMKEREAKERAEAMKNVVFLHPA
jgi:hypothetical protein